MDIKLDVNKMFDNLKKLSPALLAVCLSSGFFVVAPKSILAKLKFDSFPLVVYQIISGVFIVSSFLILTIGFFEIIQVVRAKRNKQFLEKQIDELTYDEIMRVLIMYRMPGNTLSMSIQDGVTGALRFKCIISQISNVGDGVGILTFQFILQPWVLRYLKKNLDKYSEYLSKVEEEYQKYYRRFHQGFW